MRITYDKRVDALDILLRKGRVAKTLEVAPEVFIDLDAKGTPLYVEIIGASEKIGRKNFSDVVVGRETVRIPAFVS